MISFLINLTLEFVKINYEIFNRLRWWHHNLNDPLQDYGTRRYSWNPIWNPYLLCLCCRSDSKLEFGVQNWGLLEDQNRRPICGVRAPILATCWRLLVREKSAPKWRNSGPGFVWQYFSETYFLGQICYNFMRVTFNINIDIV